MQGPTIHGRTNPGIRRITMIQDFSYASRRFRIIPGH